MGRRINECSSKEPDENQSLGVLRSILNLVNPCILQRGNGGPPRDGACLNLRMSCRRGVTRGWSVDSRSSALNHRMLKSKRENRQAKKLPRFCSQRVLRLEGRAAT